MIQLKRASLRDDDPRAHTHRATLTRVTTTVNELANVLKALRVYLDGAPSELTPIVKVNHGKVTVEALYLGNEEQAKKALTTFVDQLNCVQTSYEGGQFH